MEVSLNQLKAKQSGTVLFVKAENEALRRKLMDMGIIKGTKITVVKFAPLGDPMEIKLRGYSLTLRISDANNILMEGVI